MYLLRTALPALLRTAQGDIKSKRLRQRTAVTSTDAHAHVDSVLDQLLECVLLPLLRALTPLCFARLAPLVMPLPKKPSQLAGKGKSRDKVKDKRAATHPPKNTDARIDVFALIGTSFEALDALPPLVRPPGPGGCSASSIVIGIRDRLGLETIRELEALYAVPRPPSSSELSSESRQPPLAHSAAAAPPSRPTPTPTPLSAQSQPQSQPRTQQQRTVAESRAKRLERLGGTRAERVRALATRDAGWFLASTLNICVTPAPAPAGSGPLHCDPTAARAEHEHSGGLLRKALLDRIGKLIRSVPVPDDACHDIDHTSTNCITADVSKFATIDPVCQNMLLAICERAMTQLVPCS